MSLLTTPGRLPTTPAFRQHRLNRGETDESGSFPATDGVLPSPSHKEALIHLTPAGGLTSCDLEILFWNDRTSAFVSQNPAVEFKGLTEAASLSFDPLGRRFFVAVSALEGAGVKATGSVKFPAPTATKATGSFLCAAPAGGNYANGHGFVIGGMNYEFRLSGDAAEGWNKVDISAASTDEDIAQAVMNAVNNGAVVNPVVVASRDGATVNFEAIRYGEASNGDIGKVTGTPITVTPGGMSGGSDGNYPEGCTFSLPFMGVSFPFVFTHQTYEDIGESEAAYIWLHYLPARTAAETAHALVPEGDPPPPEALSYTMLQGTDVGVNDDTVFFEALTVGAAFNFVLTKSENCPVTLSGISGGVDAPMVSIDVAGVE